MLDEARALIVERNLEVVDVLELPARRERRASLPPSIRQGPVADKLSALGLADGSAWSHQSEALELLEHGQNIVVGTGTASGKTLIFQLRALDIIMRNVGAKVLAIIYLANTGC